MLLVSLTVYICTPTYSTFGETLQLLISALMLFYCVVQVRLIISLVLQSETVTSGRHRSMNLDVSISK